MNACCWVVHDDAGSERMQEQEVLASDVLAKMHVLCSLIYKIDNEQ